MGVLKKGTVGRDSGRLETFLVTVLRSKQIKVVGGARGRLETKRPDKKLQKPATIEGLEIGS